MTSYFMELLKSSTILPRGSGSEKGKPCHRIIMKIILSFEDTLKCLQQPHKPLCHTEQTTTLSIWNVFRILKCTLLTGTVTFARKPECPVLGEVPSLLAPQRSILLLAQASPHGRGIVHVQLGLPCYGQLSLACVSSTVPGPQFPQWSQMKLAHSLQVQKVLSRKRYTLCSVRTRHKLGLGGTSQLQISGRTFSQTELEQEGQEICEPVLGEPLWGTEGTGGFRGPVRTGTGWPQASHPSLTACDSAGLNRGFLQTPLSLHIPDGLV